MHLPFLKNRFYKLCKLWHKQLFAGFAVVGLGLIAFSSCKFKPNVQGKGEAFMQGVWNEDSVTFSKQLKTYTQHHFKITCDSIYIDFLTHSKVNLYEDSCFNRGLWKEYAKGVYTVHGDTLSISATYTHANYKQKISGCYHIGRYEKLFLIKKKLTDTLILENLNNQSQVKLSLKQKITCVPKPL